MRTPQDLLQQLTDINYMLHELKTLLSLSTDALALYLKPLTHGAPNEYGESKTELGIKDFVPQQMEWPYCLDAIYGYKVMPDRVPSSLPRTVGHIVIPDSYINEAWLLVLKINAGKDMFHKGCKELYQASGAPKSTTYSEFLRHQEIFNDGEHYEMVIRPLITSRHAYARSIGKDVDSIDFQSLRNEDFFKVKKMALNWVTSNYTQIHKGNYETVRALEEVIKKTEVSASLDNHHLDHPMAVYVKRFYIPPAPIARYLFKDKWLSNKFTVNSPVLVFDLAEEAKLKTRLERIPVKLHNGTVRATETIDKLNEKMVELHPGSNWYALL